MILSLSLIKKHNRKTITFQLAIQFEPKKLELMTRIREFDNESHPPFLCANG